MTGFFSANENIVIARSDITGLILAGGQGQRLQQRDKGMLNWHGKHLLDYAVAALTPLVDSLVISCNRNLHFYQQYDALLCQDQDNDFAGPLAGIASAIALIDSPYLLVSPCDMPGLTTAVLRPLLENSNNHCDVIYLVGNQQPQYLCALLRSQTVRDKLPAYLATGKRSVQGWYQQLQCQYIAVADSPHRFRNINTVADLGKPEH